METENLIVPVSPALEDALVVTASHIRAMGDRAQDWRSKTNDFNSYKTCVTVLEDLTRAVLSLGASAPLIVQPDSVGGARIDVNNTSSLMKQANRAAVYLRTTASTLIAVNEFSAYDIKETAVVLDLTKSTYGLVLSAIRREVNADLNRLGHLDPSELLNVAADISGRLSDIPVPAEQTPSAKETRP